MRLRALPPPPPKGLFSFAPCSPPSRPPAGGRPARALGAKALGVWVAGFARSGPRSPLASANASAPTPQGLLIAPSAPTPTTAVLSLFHHVCLVFFALGGCLPPAAGLPPSVFHSYVLGFLGRSGLGLPPVCHAQCLVDSSLVTRRVSPLSVQLTHR